MLSIRRGLFFSCALLASPASASQADPHPAASLRDVRDHFAGCFAPPGEAANTRVTFYFSMNAKGGVVAAPRTTWLGFTGSPQDRDREIGKFVQSFDACLPVALDRRMAATLPGKVYFLQYVVGRDGHEEQVLLRPFGSHGGGGPGIIAPREPVGPGNIEPPPVGTPSLAARPEPMHGPGFDTPIVIPPRRR
jgi:hypothetical protein